MKTGKRGEIKILYWLCCFSVSAGRRTEFTVSDPVLAEEAGMPFPSHQFLYAASSETKRMGIL